MKTKVCPQCHEQNPPDAKMCWACHTPLDEVAIGEFVPNEPPPTTEASKICSQCQEENPTKATHCWQCCAPLGGMDMVVPQDRNIDLPELDWWLAKASILAPCLLIGSFIPSRRWGRKTRFGVLGFSAGVLALIFARKKQEEEQKKLTALEIPPIIRIRNTILLYALKDGAHQISLIVRKRGYGVQVNYQIGGEWHEQMKIPYYVWEPLKEQLLKNAGSGNIDFDADGEKGLFQLRLLIEPPKEEIILTLLENS